jgi:hypothetical protein
VDSCPYAPCCYAALVTGLKEEVGEEEAEQAQSSHDLDGHALRRLGLNTHAGGTSSDAFRCILSNCASLPLPQTRAIGLGREFRDLRPGGFELLLKSILGSGRRGCYGIAGGTQE